jgi:hypothetical protein
MAGNTQSYKIALAADGQLKKEVVDFSPRFCETVDAAIYRLRNADVLHPPHVRFGDWPELARRWAEERGEVTP